MNTPFRYDFVGSFLRPQKLKDARKNFEEGTISQEKLTAVEDECILELVAKIKELGYHVITDGEFRRSTWHLDFMWGFEGIEHQKTVEGNTTFDAEAAMIDDTYMTGKISVKNHPFVEHFKFIKALEDENTVAKQTIPSPGQFYAYFTGAQLLNTTLEIYGSEEAFAEDVIKAYGEFVQEIYAAGCRNLQFDDCVWGGMVDAKMAVALTGRTGQRLEDYKKLLLELNNQVVAQAPELEDKEKVIARIHEAAKYVPLDRLYLSPQCGFASCEIGNKLTEEEQWAKLKLVKEIADEVWSDR